MHWGHRDLDLNWLQDFVVLGRTLNFTRAAQERNITQPAFSRRIRSLEIWLGTPLIKRTTYPVQLTDAGLQFLSVAREVASTLTDTRQAIRAEVRGTTAFQRFAVLHTISVNYLSQKLADLERDIAGLRVRVFSDHLPNCCQMLQEGACDFLLYYSHTDVTPALDERQFQRKDIGTVRMLPVAEATAARQGGWTLSAPPAADLPYLSYDPNSFLGAVVDQTIGNRKPRLTIRYMDALTESIKRRVLAGSGIAWLPEDAIRTELQDGVLHLVGGAEWHANMTLSLFCSIDRLDRTGRAVWDAL